MEKRTPETSGLRVIQPILFDSADLDNMHVTGRTVPTLPTKPTTESRVADALHRLDNGIAELCTTPGWLAWLRMQTKFHTYSVNNTLLIGMQCPDATRVAGFAAWKELGRFVRKGEKGITILAPLTYRAKADSTASAHADSTIETVGAAGLRRASADTESPARDSRRSGAESRRHIVVGFRTVSVFDIAQTEGEPLPATPARRLEGEAPDGIAADMERQIERLGYRLSTVPLPGERNGMTNFLEETVLIAEGLSPAQRAKTLTHELAHIHLHHPDAGTLKSYADCRGTVELEAESVAYVVCAASGLDTADYSFGYVASWAGTDVAARNTLAARAESIRRAAHRILEGEAPAWFTHREAA